MILKLLFSISVQFILKPIFSLSKIRISTLTLSLLFLTVFTVQAFSVPAEPLYVVDPVISDEIKITPNPTNGEVYIYGDMDKVEIYDVLGKKVFETERREFDIAVLDAGVYLVKVIHNDKGTVKRLIKN
ncbi:MAG: T9SS type A sorting domain-containing protein [Bacteroidia bacterium]|nr:T9SS type A sorting domain-containing protein [Bacteroidia bacterium]NND50973.1 T9SS type A sorting domain-containing protein [Flavobacteriaceae bacterium]